ncbi:hypothetical protein BLNAU_10985 [Blattamonas nauphoetae]|uniref:Uncharacterized protein n=1 Tax=Blattamonas nauphoetae TaxID=2049346 RepID=A0ABQ9XNN0_9EUKA|nr:hypothetical protein BLNAU_10985 [Blattamonas nauphoetae]
MLYERCQLVFHLAHPRHHQLDSAVSTTLVALYKGVAILIVLTVSTFRRKLTGQCRLTQVYYWIEEPTAIIDKEEITKKRDLTELEAFRHRILLLMDAFSLQIRKKVDNDSTRREGDTVKTTFLLHNVGDSVLDDVLDALAELREHLV